MAMFALLKNSDDEIIQEVDGDKRFRSGQPPTLKSEKGIRWLALVIVKPDADGNTQVRTGPVDVVTATEVTRTWTVRSKTAAELSADKDVKAERIVTSEGCKALLLALNDGSFVPGSDYTNDQIKAKIKAKL
jgi:hypothetical protein